MASSPEAKAPRLRWGRALIAALVAEVALMVVAGVIYGIQADPTHLLNLVTPPAAFIVFIPAGYWTAKRVLPGTELINGATPGLWGVVLYILLGVVASQFAAGTSVTDGFTPAYLAAHGLKIVGGVLGGWLAARRAT
jgi:hypothetical protein